MVHILSKLLKSETRGKHPCKLTLTRAKSVVVKLTRPSSSIGMFIRTRRLYDNRSGHLEPKPSGGSICFNRANISV